MAPVRGPGRSGRKPLGPTRPGCSASREIGETSAECSALGPLRGRSGPLCGPPLSPSGLRPAPAFSSLAPSRGLAVVGGARSGRVAPPLPLGRSGGLGLPPPRLRPSPGSARPPTPRPLRVLRAARAGCGALVGWVGLGLLRAPCGRPARLCGLPVPPLAPRGSPLRSTPCGGRPPGARSWAGPPPPAPPAVPLRGPPGAALRASGLLPPGGAGRALRARLSASAPPGVGRVPPSGQPGKGQARRPKAALAWPSCLRHVGAKPPKGGLDKLEHLCYYDGAGASRFPPPALCWT